MKFIFLSFLLLNILIENSCASSREEIASWLVEAETIIQRDGHTARSQQLLIDTAHQANPEDIPPEKCIMIGHFLKDSLSEKDELAFNWVIAGLKAPVLRDKYALSYYGGIAEEMSKGLKQILTSEIDLVLFKSIILKDWEESRALLEEYQPPAPSNEHTLTVKRPFVDLEHSSLGALQIAAYIIAQFNNTINTIVLEKLLYFSHVVKLLNDHHPLYHSAIEAWRQGPVTRDVYYYYREHTRGINGNIHYTVRAEEYREVLDHPKEKVLIDSVIDVLKKYTSEELSSMSHDGVWCAARRNEVLSPTELLAYYSENPPIFLQEVKDKIHERSSKCSL